MAQLTKLVHLYPFSADFLFKEYAGNLKFQSWAIWAGQLYNPRHINMIHLNLHNLVL